MELRLPLEMSPGREAACRAVFGTWGFFPNDARKNCPFVLTSFTGWSSERCPGIGFLSRGDREIGVLRNAEPPTRPRLECLRETGLILRCDRKVGNPFQTKQGSRPSCPVHVEWTPVQHTDPGEGWRWDVRRLPIEKEFPAPRLGQRQQRSRLALLVRVSHPLLVQSIAFDKRRSLFLARQLTDDHQLGTGDPAVRVFARHQSAAHVAQVE